MADETTAVVYTETVVHAAPVQFAAEAPYQIAIIEFEDGHRQTVRIEGERVAIEDQVEFVEERRGVPFYRKV